MSECVSIGKNEERISRPKLIYAVAMGILLISYLPQMLFYSDSYTVPVGIQIARLATAVAGMILGKTWKDRGFRFLAIFWLLMLLRLLFDNPVKLVPVSVCEALFNGIWAFLGCYSLGRILSIRQVKKLFMIILGIWTAGMVVYSGIGILVAWTGKAVQALAEGDPWRLQDQRLFLIYYVTVSGAVLSISTIIALLMAFISTHKVTRLLYVLSVFPMLMALTLTDSRASQVSVSAGIGVLFCIWVLYRWYYSRPEENRTKHPLLLWIFAVTGMFLIFIGLLVALTKSIDLFNRIRADGGLLPLARAEEVTVVKDNIANRGFFGENTLSDRPYIWSHVLDYLKKNPVYLLIGASIHAPMAEIIPDMFFAAGHCHCIPLQILLESGIPGLLLVFGFVGCVTVAGVRLVTSRDRPLWQRLTVAPVISVFVGELVESFTSLVYSWPILPFLFVFMGIVVSLGKKEQ